MDEPRNRAAIGVAILVSLGSAALALAWGYVAIVIAALSTAS